MGNQRLTSKTLISLKRAANYVDRQLRQDILRYGVNPYEFAMIELLYHKGDQPLSYVKERVLITSSNASYTVKKLVCQGFVIEENLCHDARNKVLKLTQKGIELMETHFHQHQQAIDEVFEPLSSQQLEQLQFLLKKISRYSTRKETVDE